MVKVGNLPQETGVADVAQRTGPGRDQGSNGIPIIYCKLFLVGLMFHECSHY